MIECQGVANGVSYLHESSHSKVIHRDIEASNILLDEHYHPKITYFRLSRPIEEDALHTHTVVVKTAAKVF